MFFPRSHWCALTMGHDAALCNIEELVMLILTTTAEGINLSCNSRRSCGPSRLDLLWHEDNKPR